MEQVKRILTVVDPTRDATLESQIPVKKALEIARAADAVVELFVCDYNQYISGERFFDSPGLKKTRDSYIRNRQRSLDEFAASLDTQQLAIETSVVWDHPLHDGIVRKVLRSKPDLVIKDTHFHPKVERAFFTNTDWHLIRDCPAPLMLIKTERWPKSRAVLAAVDPMDDHDRSASLDHRLIEWGQYIAELIGGEAHVFHAYMPIMAAFGAAVGAPEPIMLPVDYTDEKIKKLHYETMNELLQGQNIAEENIHIEAGSAARELDRLAEKLDAALVIMGAVARTGLQRVFLGSTAERVLGELNCDVLILKPIGFHSPVDI